MRVLFLFCGGGKRDAGGGKTHPKKTKGKNKTTKQQKVVAIHPGYGFLSENADFARRCKEEGIVFIGPSAETMEAMGDKISARKRMIDAGVPVVPGTQQPLQDVGEACRGCREIGFPVLLKAAMGGGGQ